MKLAQSVLMATVLHGVVFGVAAAVLPAAEPAPPARAPVEVDVVAATPDPVSASTSAGPSPGPAPGAAAPPPVTHRHRSIARGALAATLHSPTAEPAGGEARAEAGPPPATTVKGGAASFSAAAPSAGAIASAKPRYRTNPLPEYPIPSRRRREEGIVYLNVTVQPNGWAAAVSLNRSSGHPLLDQAAIDAVRRWTFDPGRAGGVPVSSLVVVPVRFFLSELP